MAQVILEIFHATCAVGISCRVDMTRTDRKREDFRQFLARFVMGQRDC